MHGDGEGFGVVADAAAAHREQQVGVRSSRDLDPLFELFARGIGHDARDLGDRLAAFVQYLDHLLVDPVFLDRTAAVDKDDALAVFCQLAR